MSALEVGACDLIPTFDGSGKDRLREFLGAYDVMYQMTRPEDEAALTEIIRDTKLQAQAMIKASNKKILTYGQLRELLEAFVRGVNVQHASYSRKKCDSSKNLIIFGKNLASKRTLSGKELKTFALYKTSMENGDYSLADKQRILKFIKAQALINYQIGLNKRLQTIVHLRAPATLADAITAAMKEEKVRATTNSPRRESETYKNPLSTMNSYPRDSDRRPIYQKCGKEEHHSRECQNSRYANRFSLSKPDGLPRVNATKKVCSYCRKPGHTVKKNVENYTENGPITQQLQQISATDRNLHILSSISKKLPTTRQNTRSDDENGAEDGKETQTVTLTRFSN